MSIVGEERKEIILDLLNFTGRVRTTELVKKLQVSSETIRRYLEELEDEKKLKRVYGGAIKIIYDREEPSLLNRQILYSEEKKRIGRTAANMIKDNDVIIIDDGTTSFHIIHYLINKKNIKVITCSVPALTMLMKYQNKGSFSGEIYFIGGKVQSKHFRVSGAFAEKIMDSFFVDRAFISIDGILLKEGITSYDLDRAVLVQKFIERSEESVVLLDHSKIGVSTFYKIADLQAIDFIISDVAAPQDWSAELDAQDINWIVAN